MPPSWSQVQALHPQLWRAVCGYELNPALRDELIARGGGYAEALARGRAVRVSLNQTMTDEAAALSEGAEVAFFPPVTGG